MFNAYSVDLSELIREQYQFTCLTYISRYRLKINNYNLTSCYFRELKKRWCPHCNATFENMEQHNDNHKNDDFKCQFCSKVFTGKGHLTEHLRCHSGLFKINLFNVNQFFLLDVRPYNCKTCGKCFISQRHLNVHHRVHSNEKPYKCRVCTKAFNQFNSLKVHYQQHEDNVGLKDDTENNMENQIMHVLIV